LQLISTLIPTCLYRHSITCYDADSLHKIRIKSIPLSKQANSILLNSDIQALTLPSRKGHHWQLFDVDARLSNNESTHSLNFIHLSDTDLYIIKQLARAYSGRQQGFRVDIALLD
jgi:hypothetical protein